MSDATVALLDHTLSVIESIIANYGWQVAVVLLSIVAILILLRGRLEYETARRVEAETISKAVASQARQIDGFTATSNEMKQELLRVTNELQHYVQQNGAQSQRISQLEHQLSELTLEVERLKIVRDDLQTRYNEMLKVNDQMEEVNESLTTINNQLRQKLDMVQNQLTLCQRRLSEMDSETEPLNPAV